LTRYCIRDHVWDASISKCSAKWVALKHNFFFENNNMRKYFYYLLKMVYRNKNVSTYPKPIMTEMFVRYLWMLNILYVVTPNAALRFWKRKWALSAIIEECEIVSASRSLFHTQTCVIAISCENTRSAGRFIEAFQRAARAECPKL
jgi:hypothetical protein